MSTSLQKSSTADGTLSFITPKKGLRLLRRSDQVYRCNKKTVRKKYWKRTETGCSIVAHSDKNEIYLCGGHVTHDYEPNLHLTRTRSLHQQMKERVLNELTPIDAVYEGEIMKASLNNSSSVRFLCDLVNSNAFSLIANKMSTRLRCFNRWTSRFLIFLQIDVMSFYMNVFAILTIRSFLFDIFSDRYFLPATFFSFYLRHSARPTFAFSMQVGLTENASFIETVVSPNSHCPSLFYH